MQLKDFLLAWRWTDEKYALLPEKVLSQIEPYSEERCLALFRRSHEFNGADGLDEAKYSLTQLPTEHLAPETVSDWLLARHHDAQTLVVLSWQPSTAVATTWGIFARYWNEFCYPASDDVNVWSESHTWVLLYRHDELLQFGERI